LLLKAVHKSVLYDTGAVLCLHILMQQSGYKEKGITKGTTNAILSRPGILLGSNYTRWLKISHACAALTHVDWKAAISSETAMKCNALEN
jgi:hypothetical protein